MITQLINKLIYRKKSIYTKEERYEKYYWALHNIDLISPFRTIPIFKHTNMALCTLLDCVGNDILEFPEIIKYKPLFTRIGVFWWPMDEKGYNIRVKILQQALKETE